MFLLYELINLLPPTYAPVFAPRLNTLLLFLMENKGLTEDEACAAHLKSIKHKKYFNKMKNQLQSQLSHYLLVSPSSPDNRHKTLYEECYKDYAAYKVFLMNGKREMAMVIAKNLVPKLEKMEFHSLLHLVAQDLLFHYGSIKGDSRLMKKYERMAATQLEITKAESMIRMYHSRVGFICNSRDSFTPSMVREIEEAAENVTPLLRLGSSHLNRFIYSIIVSRYAVVYDNANMIKYCDEALSSFPENHPNSRSLRFSFMQNKILSLAALGRIREAKTIAKDVCGIVPKGSFNWHTALLKRFISKSWVLNPGL